MAVKTESAAVRVARLCRRFLCEEESGVWHACFAIIAMLPMMKMLFLDYLTYTFVS